MGRRGIGGLKTRVGRECSISRRRARLYSGGMRVGEVRGESHGVMSGNTAPRKRAVKSSKLQRESCEHLRLSHLEEVCAAR